MIVWMGEKLLFGMSIVVMLVMRFYFEQIRKVVLTYKDAAGMWWADKWKPLVGCLVNLILNIILVKSIGVAGVMLSTIISYTLIELPWETKVLFKIYFKQSPKNYYFDMVTISVSMLIAGVATYYVCSFINLGHIANIIAKLIVCIIAPNILFMILNIRNKNYYVAVRFVKGIIGRYIWKRS